MFIDGSQVIDYKNGSRAYLLAPNGGDVVYKMTFPNGNSYQDGDPDAAAESAAAINQSGSTPETALAIPDAVKFDRAQPGVSARVARVVVEGHLKTIMYDDGTYQEFTRNPAYRPPASSALRAALRRRVGR